MEQIWEILSHWSEPEFLAWYGEYLVIIIFLYSFLEVLFPPIPGDTLLVLSGSITGYTGISPIGIILSASLGTFAASALLYDFGTRMEKALLHSNRFSKILDSKTFHKLEKCFRDFGFWTILLSRFLPVARSGIILAAGMVKMRKTQSLTAVGFSIIISTTLFVMGGRFLGRSWRRLTEWHYHIKMVLLVLLCLMTIYIILNYLYKLCRNQKKNIREQNE